MPPSVTASTIHGHAQRGPRPTAPTWVLGVFILGIACVVALALAMALGQGTLALILTLTIFGTMAFAPIAIWFPGLFEQTVLFLIGVTLPLTLVILKKHFVFREEPHYGGSIGLQITATDLLMALMLFGVWIGAVAKPGKRPRLDPAILKGFVLYYVLVIPSAVFGHDVVLGAYELASLIQTFAFFIFMLYFLSTGRQIRAFAGGLVMSLLLQSVVTIIQQERPGSLSQFTPGAQEAENARVVKGRLALPDMDAGTTFIGGELQVRPTGLIAHPNLLAGFLAMLMPVAFSLWVAGPPLLRWFATLTLPFSAVAMYFTLSRSGWIGLLAGMAIALGVSLKWRILRLSLQQKLIALTLFVAAIGGLATQASKIYLRLTETATDAIDYRRDLGIAALKMAVVHPFLGVGLNSFDTAVLPYDSSQDSKYKKLPVHNILLLELGEIGIFGFTAFVILWTVVLRLMFRAARQCTSRSQKLLALFSCCGVIAFFVTDLSGPVFRTPTFTSMIWAQVALSLAISRLQMKDLAGIRPPQIRELQPTGGTVHCMS
jgi:putative inorganic carbon (HCO3(-)) transporter